VLTNDETKRLKQAILAAIASPLIGSIEDYSWEAIFHYIKNIPLSDPALGRSKLLYDAVDSKTASGWSLKSLQLNSLTTHNWEPLLFNTGTRRFAPVKLLKMSSTAMREYC